MNIKYIGQFSKHFKQRIKPNSHLLGSCTERTRLFIESPKHPLLKDHKLKGKQHELRAFSITGDVRVVYFIEGDIIYFIDVGSHHQVY